MSRLLFIALLPCLLPAFTYAAEILAAQLYRAITGRDAQARDVTLDFPLLPPNALIKSEAPLESQKQIAGDGKRIVIKADALAPLLDAAKQ